MTTNTNPRVSGEESWNIFTIERRFSEKSYTKFLVVWRVILISLFYSVTTIKTVDTSYNTLFYNMFRPIESSTGI
jgi:hypothetical protein